MSFRVPALILGFALTLAGCASTPPASVVLTDVRGNWSYTLTDTNNNTWDAGTLALDGDDAAGTVEQLDYYQTADTGTWTLNEGVLHIDASQTWDGSAVARNRIEGTWSAPSGDHGTFVLIRK